jgi:hypothetical protein
MSHQRKLEQAFEYLLAEDTERATKLIHQVIVEKARGIYESIIDEEFDELDEADVGGEPNKDFTDEISTDSEEIDSEEVSGGEAGSTEDDFEVSASDKDDEEGDEDEAEEGDEDEDEGDEDNLEAEVDALRAELNDLRADFEALMGEEMQEPQHADLPGKMGGMGNEMGGSMGAMPMEDDMHAPMFEKKKKPKLEVAEQPSKKPAKGKKEVEEETQFLSKVADTGQKGTAKLVGAGTHSKLGAEQNKSTFTNPPKKNDYGGKPVDFTKGTGGEYGKYHGDSAKDDTPSDNVNEQPKKSSIKADSTPKYTGGKAAGQGFDKSPFTSKPR